ncbi:MAG: hypothetical protein HY875_17460 [Chloroflexi bacterium]|nr:hypothetical protein [Chloroflexota bacterium]
MTAPLQVGQFAIVDSEPVDRGPNAGVFHGKGPADDRAELFLVAEGTTPAGESFAGHVVSTLGQAFATMDMSLTGSLRRLFAEAERNLRDWNRKSIAQHRVSLGLSCFGRRGEQAVLAQAGPSVAFHLHNGVATAYYSDEEHGRPIGLGGPVEPQMTKLDFALGDRVLLITTPALAELDDEVIGGILALPAAQVLPDLYHRLQHLRHLTTVLVMHDPATAQPGPPQLPPGENEFVIGSETDGEAAAAVATSTANNPFQPALFIGSEQHETAVDAARRQLAEVTPRRRVETSVPAILTEIPAPLRRASGDDTLSRLAAERRSRAQLGAASIPAQAMSSRPSWRTNPGGGSGNGNSDSTGGWEVRRRHGRKDSFSRGLVKDEPPPRPQATAADAPLAGDMAASLRGNTGWAAPSGEAIAAEAAGSINGGGPLVRVRDSMGGRWRGEGSLSRGHRAAIGGQLPPTWLVILIGLGLLLGLVAVLTVPQMLQEESSQRYARLVDSAQRQLAAARVQQDPAARRTALTDAQALLLEANDSERAGPQVEQLLADVAAAIKEMDAVRSPARVETVASLEQFGQKPVAAARLAIGPDQGFILDSQQVIAVNFADAERAAIFAEDKEAKHGRPVAIAWAANPDNKGAALLIADSSRNLWAWSKSGGLRQLPFAAPQDLAATDIALRAQELYVLDAAKSVVYRFTPGEGGFANPPVKAIDNAALAHARRLMVDTSEYVTADEDGTVRRYYGQLSLELSEAGIDRPLIAPETPQPFTNGDLAVLDAPNNRIVVFRRDGTFSYQYQHKDFASMSAFAMYQGVGYVFSAGQLRRVTWQ